jgi:hypothetical protein
VVLYCTAQPDYDIIKKVSPLINSGVLVPNLNAKNFLHKIVLGNCGVRFEKKK